MTDAEIIAAYDRADIAPALSRLIHLSRIGAAVEAADDATAEKVAKVLCVSQDANWDRLDTRARWYWCANARAALAALAGE
jgi:hypothetical protein